MIEAGRTYVVMGLLDSDSIAYAIGQRVAQLGGRVVYTVQNERMKSIFLDRSDKRLPPEELARLDIRFCEVTDDKQIAALFAGTGPVAGVVHSIAYANPRTCLGEEFHTDAIDDLKMAYHISCASLARIAFHAKPTMADGGSIVALTFDAARAYAYYNWMGVNKAALEALVRALARRHGRDLIRVNAVSAGPLHSKAASKIPGFNKLHKIWRSVSPLPWDVETDKDEVANMAVFLLGPLTKKVTGQIIHVDGGASAVAGMLMPFEQWQYPTAFLIQSRPARPSARMLPPGTTTMAASGAVSTLNSGVTVTPPMVLIGRVDSATVTTRKAFCLSARMKTSAGPAKSISSTPSNNRMATVLGVMGTSLATSGRTGGFGAAGAGVSGVAAATAPAIIETRARAENRRMVRLQSKWVRRHYFATGIRFRARSSE